MTGLAEMYVGTMHGYALDLLQRLVPDTFKYSVLTDITNQLFIDRYSGKSGLTSCPTTAAQGTLRRYLNSKLYMQVLSVLREDKIDYSPGTGRRYRVVRQVHGVSSTSTRSSTTPR